MHMVSKHAMPVPKQSLILVYAPCAALHAPVLESKPHLIYRQRRKHTPGWLATACLPCMPAWQIQEPTPSEYPLPALACLHSQG